MNQFLKHCRSLLGNKLPKLIVLGNESCDLDSAVCCLCLAFNLTKNPGIIKPLATCANAVLPVLNVTREELPLKTEVVHFLRSHQIDLANLVCRDEVDLPDEPSETKFVLVDHHVSKFRRNVVAVVDHRPLDGSAGLDEGTFKFIEGVGSCATLVTKLMDQVGLCKDVTEETAEVLKLLYGPIVLDTVNFSQEADRARPLDHEMAALIERCLKVESTGSHRKQLFDELVEKRADVSSLDSLQILSKDLKIVTKNGITVAIPGYPILVQEYIKLNGAADNLRKFADKTNSNVIVLMGMKVTDGSVKRDLGVININNERLHGEILNKLTSSVSPNFEFKKHENVPMDGSFFEQRNIRVTRKHLLPLVTSVVEGFGQQ